MHKHSTLWVSANLTKSWWYSDDSDDLRWVYVEGNYYILLLWSWASSGPCALRRGHAPALPSCTVGWSSIRSQLRAPDASAYCASSAKWFFVGDGTFRSTACRECLSSTGRGWETWWKIISEKGKPKRKIQTSERLKVIHDNYITTHSATLAIQGINIRPDGNFIPEIWQWHNQ